jgi:hypothetical protein
MSPFLEAVRQNSEHRVSFDTTSEPISTRKSRRYRSRRFSTIVSERFTNESKFRLCCFTALRPCEGVNGHSPIYISGDIQGVLHITLANVCNVCNVCNLQRRRIHHETYEATNLYHEHHPSYKASYYCLVMRCLIRLCYPVLHTVPDPLHGPLGRSPARVSCIVCI